MASITYNPDYFRLWIENTVNQGYFKNGNSRIGEYERAPSNFYTAECLFACSVAGIPSGSTINSVSVDFTINSTTLAGNQTLNLVEQNKGSWTDNGVSAPTFVTFPQTSWNTVLSSVTVGTSTGSFSVPTSSALVALFQAFVNGTKNAADGMVLSMNPQFFGWYILINSVAINVNYTPPANTAKSGFFMLSKY